MNDITKDGSKFSEELVKDNSEEYYKNNDNEYDCEKKNMGRGYFSCFDEEYE